MCYSKQPTLTPSQHILTALIFTGAGLIYKYIFPFFYHQFTSNPQFPEILLTLIVIAHLGFLLWPYLGQILRRCGRKGCKGMNRAPEFIFQVQGAKLLKNGDKAVRDVDELPWKGRSENDPFYESLRVKLRKRAPHNGRAVMLLCGCSVSKIQGWGTSIHGGRRRKK